MDRAYYDASRAAVQRDHIIMQQELARLKARNAQLEQLVKEYRSLLHCWDAPSKRTSDLNAYGQHYQAAEKQYKALLEQESNS